MKGPILKGGKIILKPVNIKEAANYVKWFTDKEVTQFLSMDGKGLTLKKEKDLLRKSLVDKTRIIWGIYTKGGKHIGSTGLNHIDEKNKKVVWGITIGDKSHWGQGLGTDVLKTILKYAFKKMKVNRFELGVFKFNKRGMRCYEKCGLKFEGIKKGSIYKNGKYIDEIVMAILKKDYL